MPEFTNRSFHSGGSRACEKDPYRADVHSGKDKRAARPINFIVVEAVSRGEERAAADGEINK